MNLCSQHVKTKLPDPRLHCFSVVSFLGKHCSHVSFALTCIKLKIAAFPFFCITGCLESHNALQSDLFVKITIGRLTPLPNWKLCEQVDIKLFQYSLWSCPNLLYASANRRGDMLPPCIFSLLSLFSTIFHFVFSLFHLQHTLSCRLMLTHLSPCCLQFSTRVSSMVHYIMFFLHQPNSWWLFPCLVLFNSSSAAVYKASSLFMCTVYALPQFSTYTPKCIPNTSNTKTNTCSP